MHLVSPSPVQVAWLPFQVTPPDHTLTCIVKATYRLRHGAAAEIVDASAQLPINGDEPKDDSPNAALHYASDLAPFKLEADLHLVGRCHPREDSAVESSAIGFTVGDTTERLIVFGDRIWKKGILRGWEISQALPFTSMDIGLDRAFGGPDSIENKAGRGQGKDQSGQSLPNVEDPKRILNAPSDKVPSAGFGPIAPGANSRRQGMGSYDQSWLEERWPAFPADFDWTYFNAAPAALRVDGYLKGDEELRFENLHAEHPIYESRLPGHAARLFLHKTGSETETETFEEVQLSLDTLWVDMESETLVLVWRGRAPISKADFPEIAEVYAALESIDERASIAQHRDVFVAMTSPQPDVEDLEEPSDDSAAVIAEIQGQLDAQAAKVEAATQASMDEIADYLKEAGAPEHILKAVAGEADPEAAIEKLMAASGVEHSDVEAFLAESKQNTQAMLEKHGYDPSVLDDTPQGDFPELEASAPEPGTEAFEQPLTREDVIAYTQKSWPLAGREMRGLDLSELDLSEADFAGSDLSGCDFSKSTLDRADFTKADLSGAKFDGCQAEAADFAGSTLSSTAWIGAMAAHANFEGVTGEGMNIEGADFNGAVFSAAELSKLRAAAADLQVADFTGATVDQADFSGGKLAYAGFEQAQVSDSKFEQADCTAAVFVQANLTRAKFSKATCTAADFHAAVLDAANFEHSKLDQARLETARGRDVSFRHADLSGMRASEQTELPGADFRDVTAAGSFWVTAKLSGARFEGAILERADFSEADLSNAKFDRAVMRHSNFSAAKLIKAELLGADLFESRFEQADLTETDFTASNCYGSEFLDATLEGTIFDGSNLKATKLAESHKA